MAAHENAPKRILRRKEVEEVVGLKRSAIYAGISRREFPAPILLSTRAVGWIESEIEDWLNQRAIARQSTPRRSAPYCKTGGDALSDRISSRTSPAFRLAQQCADEIPNKRNKKQAVRSLCRKLIAAIEKE